MNLSEVVLICHQIYGCYVLDTDKFKWISTNITIFKVLIYSHGTH